MKNLRFSTCLWVALLLLSSSVAKAQSCVSRLLETHWQYTYTLHLETNSLIQQAGDQLRHFLYFRFDSVCRQNLNGKTAETGWWTDSQQLHLAFRQNDQFDLTCLNDYSLELKYHSKDGKSTYVHHFVRIRREESPLTSGNNMLPVVQVQTVSLPKTNPALAASQPISLPAPGDGDVAVELTGGGYYGGINPVQHDYITIGYDGRLIHEFESMQGKRLVQKANVSKEELEKFIEWATKEQHFPDMASSYDCKTPDCEKRKSVKPTPVPLRLSIAAGETRKMVTISIWGLDRNGRRYVSYPPEIDRIVDAIQRMANAGSVMK
ncbi:MAG: hypothetical protein KA165_17245 [Saprospiraceae bacterium]|nr:hypothetical protein [Saprospiraceae bacterium]